ncbi:MAG: hypothetical protein ACRDYW_01265 [Acidimicrobiales bacterium]
MTQIPAPAERREPTTTETVRLAAYIDLPLRDVLDRFSSDEVDELLSSAATHAMEGRGVVRMHASAPVWESAANVRIHLSWTTTGRSGRSVEDSGEISLLVVQSGRQAITELLAILPVTEETRRPVAETARHVLDELTLRVEAGR